MSRKTFAQTVFGAILLATASQAHALSLKNFREIRAHMDTLFRHNGESTSIERTWRGVKQRLPLQGGVSEMSSPVMLALTELAGAYCLHTVTRDSLLDVGARVLFDNVDFELGPQQFRGSVDRMINELSANLWLRYPTAPEAEQLRQTVIELVELSNPVRVEDTVKIAFTMCTMFAGSLEFIME